MKFSGKSAEFEPSAGSMCERLIARISEPLGLSPREHFPCVLLSKGKLDMEHMRRLTIPPIHQRFPLNANPVGTTLSGGAHPTARWGEPASRAHRVAR